MANHKHFFQDRTVLLLISIETFLVLLITALILLQLSAASGTVTFMSQFRALPNAGDFVSGGLGINGTVWDIVGFIFAGLLMYGIGMVMGYRVYKVRRELALVVLGLTLVLLMFILAVSNILLVIR